MDTAPQYEELQRFPRVWLAVLLAVPALLLGGVTPFSVLGWAIWGVVALLLFSVQLRTVVRADGVYVKLWPLHWSFRHVPWADIEHYESIEYNSLLRFGGWGLRITPSEIAYNVAGSHGVLLERPGKRSVLVGSARAEELASAIETQFGHHAPR